MAFILKSSRLMSRLIGVACQANLTNVSKDPWLTQWNTLMVTNALLKRGYTAAAPAEVMTADMLEKSIYQLDLDARYKGRVLKKDIDIILSAMKRWKNVSYPQSLLLLKCCCNLCLLEKPEERIDLAKKVWKTLGEIGIQYDIYHYNSLLNVYLENEYKFSPEEFLETLKKNGLKPNLVTYQRLIKAYCQDGNITGASKMLEEIKSADLPVTDDIFNSLIFGHCQVNDVEGALGIIELMEKKGIEPNSESYRHILCLHAKKGNMSEIQKVLEECEKKEIVIMSKDLFEVVYNLAVNGHTEHIDTILNKINKNFNYNYQAVQVIHRLLHKNLDSVGMKIYNTLKKSNMSNDTKNYGQLIIDHYVFYRSKDDLIDTCQKLEESGLARAPLSYALRKTLEQGDNQKSLDLIQAMKRKGLPIRSHYFWPLIIKASRQGNNEILKILKQMKAMGVPRSRDTINKVLYPAFNFKGGWADALKNLKNNGVEESRISHLLLRDFLKANNIKDAVELATTTCIGGTVVGNLPGMVRCLNRNPDALDDVINILYAILHDVHCLPSTNAEEEQDSSSDEEGDSFQGRNKLIISKEKLIDEFVSILVKTCSEDVVLNVLKKMLEKKIPISKEGASVILETLQSKDIKDVVEKLQATTLELNESLLEVKRRRERGGFFFLRQAILRGDTEEAKKIFEEVKDQLTFTDILNLMTLYCRSNQIEKAMELCKILPERSTGGNLLEMRRHFSYFISLLVQAKDPENVTKAIQVGTTIGLYKENYCAPLVKVYTERDELDKAIETLASCNETEFLSHLSYSELISHLIRTQDLNRLQTVMDILTRVKGEAVSVFILIFHLAHEGQVKQATKLFESRGVLIPFARFRELCLKFYNLKSTTCLENMLIALKQSYGHYRNLLYFFLLKLYAESGETDKIRDLCLKVQAEEIPVDQSFLNVLAQYMEKINQPVPFNVNLTSQARNTERIQKRTSLTEEDLGKLYEESKKKNMSSLEAFRLARNLAAFGKTDQMIDIWNRFKLSKGAFVLNTLLLSKDLKNECLDFIKEICKKQDFEAGHLVGTINRTFKRNPDLVTEYENILMKAYQETNNIKFPTAFFLGKLTLGTVSKAEEVYEKYLTGSPELANEITSYTETYYAGNLVKSLEESDKLKSIPDLNLTDLYMVEFKKWVGARTNTSLLYLKKLVESGLGDSIDKSLLYDLKRSLESKSQEFPYPDLLTDDQKKNTMEA